MFFSVLKKSQEHFCLVWSLSFYLLENIEESHMEQNFVSTTLNAAFNLLSGRTNIHLHQTIIKVNLSIFIPQHKY